jgi:hypothetical protein
MMHNFKRALGGLVVMIAAGSCGRKEANAMEQMAGQMCACKDAACADKLFPEIEKFTKQNEGKQVEARAADAYNAALARTQKCYDDLQAEAVK